jgi:hypothetical protein
MVNRVGETLEYVPDAQESNLMGLLRASLRSHPARDAKVQLAHELTRLFLFLGEHKTAYLMMLCEQVHVDLDENMTKADADRLWEHLRRTYEEWDVDDGILC